MLIAGKDVSIARAEHLLADHLADDARDLG
jgi:hypothetical protein